jgi:hypothetical protein
MTLGQSINKEVKALDSPYVGDVVRETDEKIVVFGHCDYRFDIPKSERVAAGRNIIVGMDFPAKLKYRVYRDAPLPTGEPMDKLTEEEKNL